MTGVIARTQWGLDLLAVHRRVVGVPSEDPPDPAVEPDEIERKELEREELERKHSTTRTCRSSGEVGQA